MGRALCGSLSLVVALWATDAFGGPRPSAEARRRAQVLTAKWRQASERARDGHPWEEIGDDLEAALAKAGDASNVPIMAAHLDAIRAAQEQEPHLPANRSEASDEELITLLARSRLPEVQRDRNQLMMNPLHRWVGPGGVRQMHWEGLGEPPEHEFTDPAIRILKRGRSMIPRLIEALDDQTATRCTYISTSTSIASLLYRRCDLAMTLLEAITRCKFFPADRRAAFSQLSESARLKALNQVSMWREATRDLSPMEARSWQIRRVDYTIARVMISLLQAEGETSRAIDHWREFIVKPDGDVELSAVQSLAALGDSSGLDTLFEHVRSHGEITRNEAALMVEYGGPREFKLLKGMLAVDVRPVPEPEPGAVPGTNPGVSNGAISKEAKAAALKALKAALERSGGIIAGVTTKLNRPMAIPLLASVLDPSDQTFLKVNNLPKHIVFPTSPTRADVAAAVIQDFARQNLRYNPNATPEIRRRGIERVRQWWEREGRGLYGFENLSVRRGGGIR